MGRGGRGRGGGADDPVEAYFAAIRAGKDQTIYYHVTHGCMPLDTRNEDGRTGLMVAAMLGEEISLSQLLRCIRKVDHPSTRQQHLDDQDQDGMTALMLAAKNGHAECVSELVQKRAGTELTNHDGKTARDIAEEKGHKSVVKRLDGESSSEEEESEGVEGETGVQRRKRKKEEKAKLGGATLAATLKKSGKKDKEEVGTKGTAAVYSDVDPVLPEVKAAVANVLADGSLGAFELNLEIEKEVDTVGLREGYMDMAIWRCTALRRLQVRWKPGLVAGALEHISALKKLQTLILRESRLPELHEAVGQLPELKSIDLEGNALKALPKSLGNLKTLESFTANRNSLSSLSALSKLTNLQVVAVSGNKLVDIDDFDCSNKQHLHTFLLSNNALKELPDEIAEMSMMQTLDVSGNKLTELPHAMGTMKEKKFTTLILENNPWKDGKIRNMIEKEQDSGTLAKVVIKYLQKQKPQKGGKKSKKKKAVESSEDEADEEEAVAEPVEEEEEEPPLPPEEPAGGKKSKKKKKEKNEQASGDAETFDPPAREAEQDVSDQEGFQDSTAGKKKKSKKKKGGDPFAV